MWTFVSSVSNVDRAGWGRREDVWIRLGLEAGN